MMVFFQKIPRKFFFLWGEMMFLAFLSMITRILGWHMSYMTCILKMIYEKVSGGGSATRL